MTNFIGCYDVPSESRNIWPYDVCVCVCVIFFNKLAPLPKTKPRTFPQDVPATSIWSRLRGIWGRSQCVEATTRLGKLWQWHKTFLVVVACSFAFFFFCSDRPAHFVVYDCVRVLLPAPSSWYNLPSDANELVSQAFQLVLVRLFKINKVFKDLLKLHKIPKRCTLVA